MKAATNHRDIPLRREIARVACFEVDKLAMMLHAYIEANDSDGETAPVMRSGLMRLSDLSNIIYDAIICNEQDEPDNALISALGSRAALSEEFRGEAA